MDLLTLVTNSGAPSAQPCSRRSAARWRAHVRHSCCAVIGLMRSRRPRDRGQSAVSPGSGLPGWPRNCGPASSRPPPVWRARDRRSGCWPNPTAAAAGSAPSPPRPRPPAAPGAASASARTPPPTRAECGPGPRRRNTDPATAAGRVERSWWVWACRRTAPGRPRGTRRRRPRSGWPPTAPASPGSAANSGWPRAKTSHPSCGRRSSHPASACACCNASKRARS